MIRGDKKLEKHRGVLKASPPSQSNIENDTKIHNTNDTCNDNLFVTSYDR
jgi:hypothetical protein